MILSLARTVLLFFCAGEFAFLNLLQPRIPTRQACAHSWPISFGLAPAPPRPGAGPPPGPPGAKSEPRAVFGERGRPRPEGHRRGGVGPRGAGGAPLPPMPALRDVSPADGASVDDDDDVVWGPSWPQSAFEAFEDWVWWSTGGGVGLARWRMCPTHDEQGYLGNKRLFFIN